MTELQLRLSIVEKLSSTSFTTPESNKAASDEIHELCKQDKYFSSSDANFVPENIHTVGYMRHFRDSLELLQSVAAVATLVVFDYL